MARVCHTNNCPVGVASQREELRARFPGAPGDLVNYFHFIAEEVRAGTAVQAGRFSVPDGREKLHLEILKCILKNCILLENYFVITSIMNPQLL